MPDAKSWRKRRWDLFLTVYNSDAKFRELLKAKWSEPSALINLLAQHNIPYSVFRAIKLYMDDATLPDKQYYKLIHPPIAFWNKDSSHIMPDPGPVTLLQQMSLILLPIFKKYDISPDMHEHFTKDVLEAVALNTTIIQVQPYTGKSELKEVIMELPVRNTNTAS